MSRWVTLKQAVKVERRDAEGKPYFVLKRAGEIAINMDKAYYVIRSHNEDGLVGVFRIGLRGGSVHVHDTSWEELGL